MQTIDTARARANQIVSELSADPSRRDFAAESGDVQLGVATGCAISCSWTCSWTSFAE